VPTKAKFVKISNLFRHIESCHKSDSKVQCRPVAADFPPQASAGGPSRVVSKTERPYCTDADTDVGICQSTVASTSDSTHNYLCDIHMEAVSLVAALRANSSTPYGVIPGVMGSFNHMASSLSDFFEITAESMRRH